VQYEKRLAGRIAQGDRRAYEEFVDSYGARVHRLVLRYVDSAADAEDVTQEIFVALYKGIGGFRGESSLATWVYRIATNHCLKYRERAKPSSMALDDLSMAAADGASDPAARAAQRELADRIDGALADLSEQHRDVVVLHELHGLTYGECAAVLNVPVGTVKSRLSNAFRRLRDHLGGYVLGEPTLRPDAVTESLS
jgi:RNA polymerase sigma-70 factor (ECF subfamily)